jgi:hypothetical protein
VTDQDFRVHGSNKNVVGIPGVGELSTRRLRGRRGDLKLATCLSACLFVFHEQQKKQKARGESRLKKKGRNQNVSTQF